MTESIRIVLDAVGGDDAPAAPVAGALMAAREWGALITLVGPEAAVRAELERQRASLGGPAPSIEVVDAPDVVGMADAPVAAVRSKRRSSLVVGMEVVAKREAQAFVTAGNTGAAMAAAVLGLKRLEGIDRPALAVPFPTRKGACLLLDVGANAEVRALNLLQFAVMGSAYAERALGIERPRVGLLNIGEEESKGSAIIQEAYSRLRAAPIRFVGNVEGKDIPSGAADVVVMDGFVGNVLLKFAEGLGEQLLEIIRSEIRATPWSTLLGLGLTPAFRRVRRRLDYAEFGGAPLLGVDGVCIIAHGRSTPRAIRSALRIAGQAATGQVTELIRTGLREQVSPAPGA